MDIKALRNISLLWMGTLLSLTSGFSQSKYTPHILASEHDKELLQKFSESISKGDSAQIIRKLNSYNQRLIKEGFLTANYLTEINGDTILIAWELGNRYEWAKLNLNEQARTVLSNKELLESNFTRQKFDRKELYRLGNQLLSRAVNQGYPFASIRFANPSIEDGKISLDLCLELGVMVAFDSIAYPKNIAIKESFLKSYLGLKSEQAYKEEAIKQIPDKIRQLPYAALSGEPQLSFANHRAKVFLPLTPRKANRLDGILGLAPANELSSKPQLTGQLDLQLFNLFQSGKSLSLNWQKLRPLSQSLDLALGLPLLLGSPIHFDFGFQLFKEDTSFLRRQTNLMFSYYKGAQHKISGLASFKSANILSTTQYENQNQVPPLLDTRSFQYGLAYKYSSLNDFFDPTKGSLFLISLSVGNRKVEVNPRLNPEVYDQIQVESPVFDMRVDFKQFIKTFKDQHVFLGLHGAWLESKQLFQNELYRLGGLKSIRGFSENYFYASRYAVINLEYRIRFDAESYVFAFYDQAYTYYKVPNMMYEDFPKALGAGLNIKVSGGLLSVAYALGASEDQNFGLVYSRIHIGFVGRF